MPLRIDKSPRSSEKMPDYYSDKALYHTADRKEVVEEGDERAAFLVVGKGGFLPEAEVERLGLKGRMSAYQPADALQAAEESVQAAVERGALDQALVEQQGLERLKLARKAGPALQTSGLQVAPRLEGQEAKPAEVVAAEQASEDGESKSSARSGRGR